MAQLKRMRSDLYNKFDTEDKKNYGISIDYQSSRRVAKKQFKAMKAMQKSFGSLQNANIKTWEDRNRAIKGSKLSK